MMTDYAATVCVATDHLVTGHRVSDYLVVQRARHPQVFSAVLRRLPPHRAPRLCGAQHARGVPRRHARVRRHEVGVRVAAGVRAAGLEHGVEAPCLVQQGGALAVPALRVCGGERLEQAVALHARPHLAQLAHARELGRQGPLVSRADQQVQGDAEVAIVQRLEGEVVGLVRAQLLHHPHRPHGRGVEGRARCRLQHLRRRGRRPKSRHGIAGGRGGLLGPRELAKQLAQWSQLFGRLRGVLTDDRHRGWMERPNRENAV
jgi:hypothetical protein